MTAEKGIIYFWQTEKHNLKPFHFCFRKVTICKTETDTTKPLKEAAAEEDVKTTLEFSSADSLESSVSLVSAGISQSLVSQKTDRTPSSASSSEVTEVRVNYAIYTLSTHCLNM